MSKLLYTNLVAVVTGSGGGLGRTYALELAKRGAKIIVNDLGVMRDGDGNSLSPANSVVNEIKSFGGIAYPNYDSVADGDKIIDCAIEQFGKIDILINNAGILRDKSFASMSNADWDNVVNVHLYGAFKTTKAAWNHMRTQKFGRIIFTSSAAGIYGNFGQANYASAKLGLVGLCNTLAIEGAKYNINCNTIAPMAVSRMTEDIFPPEFLNSANPEYVSPLVLYLCHPTTTETGTLFEVGAGWIGKVRWEVSKGVVLKTENGNFYTPENVRDRWNDITDFDNSRHPSSVKDSMQNFIEVMQADLAEVNENINVNPVVPTTLTGLIGKTKCCNVDKLNFRDVILYAISVGVNNYNINYLKFLYENHSNFVILPTYAVIACSSAGFGLIFESVDRSDLGIDLSQALHAEQYLEVFKQLQTDENYSATAEIVDVVDRLRGAIVYINVNLLDKKKELVAKTQFGVYLTGAEGSTGQKRSDKAFESKVHPERQPDSIVEKYIEPNQAMLYRLNGDYNPLHIDPEVSKFGGFETPILHGLCSFGIVAQQALNIFANGDVEAFKRIKVRFSKPVIPGQTLVSEFWKDRNTIYFQCKTKETGQVCLSGGYVEFHNELIRPRL